MFTSYETTSGAPHPDDRPRMPDPRHSVVHLGSAVAIGAAIRAARRDADASTRTAIRTSLAMFADAGCPAAALVLAWFDRDTALCDDAHLRGIDVVGGARGRR